MYSDKKIIFRYLSLFIFGVFLFQSGIAQSYDENEVNPFDKLNFKFGPEEADLGDFAKVDIPDGFIFADKENTVILMEMMENPSDGTELGIVAAGDFSWFVMFSFDQIGYVKDDEKNDLDADAMLKTIIKATDEANKIRRERGWSILNIKGWAQEPIYNSETNNLEYAILGVDETGYYSLNYNSRLLGRKGVMTATLVCSPDTLEFIKNEYQNIIGSYSFKEGQRYWEFVQGDDIADIGLTALVVGGGAAVAAKSGLFKWLWKIIVIAFAAIAGFFRKLFKRDKKEKNKNDKT